MVYEDEILIITTKDGYMVKDRFSGLVVFGATVREAKEKLYRKLLLEGIELRCV